MKTRNIGVYLLLLAKIGGVLAVGIYSFQQLEKMRTQGPKLTITISREDCKL